MTINATTSGPRNPPACPLVLTLGMDDDSFGRLDGWRNEYFPPERNLVPAHLTLFHHLPGSQLREVHAEVDRLAATTPAILLRFSDPFRLSGGFALRVEAPALVTLRAALARSFDAWLTPQDRQPYRRPHVTLMNKADRDVAAVAFDHFRARFERFDGSGESIRLWAYEGGPWRALGVTPLQQTPHDPPT